MTKSRKPEETFSEYYNLSKEQFELDFVDVPIDGGDIPLFIDPYAISKREDEWYRQCASTIYDYFDHLLDLIRHNKQSDAMRLLSGLHESNETKLGYSPTNHGAAIGKKQAKHLYDSLKRSRAVETGVLKDIEECSLMIPGIDRDKISDLTTNLIKRYLIEYTQEQCRLHGVAMIERPVKNVFNPERFEWENGYHELPQDKENHAIILVPKVLVRVTPVLHSKEYYQHYILNYLQDELHSAGSSLCKVLQDGQTLRKPTKKDLTESYTRVGDPKKDETKKSLKEYIYEFSLQNPEVLREYEDLKKAEDQPLTNAMIEASNRGRQQDYEELVKKLKATQPGKENADAYHNVMIGLATAIFSPLLTKPQKESSINDNTKRIDIRFTNSATHGFFASLRPLKGIPSTYIFVECKNYVNDINNPEVDQLAMRFNKQRGQFGFLFIRDIKDRRKILKRCRAVAKDGHGFIIPLTDSDVIQLLRLKKAGKDKELDNFLEERLKEIID